MLHCALQPPDVSGKRGGEARGTVIIMLMLIIYTMLLLMLMLMLMIILMIINPIL